MKTKKVFDSILLEYNKDNKEEIFQKIEKMWYKKMKVKWSCNEEWTWYIVWNSEWEYHTSNLPKDFWLDKMQFKKVLNQRIEIKEFDVVNIKEWLELKSKDYLEWGNKRIKTINSKNYSWIVLEKNNDKSLVEFHDNHWHFLLIVWLLDENLVVKK